MIDQSGCRCQRCACRINRLWRRPHCWLTQGTVRDEMRGNGPLWPRPWSSHDRPSRPPKPTGARHPIHHAGIAHARCPPHAVGAQWLAGSAHAALCRGHQPTGEPGAVAPLSHHYTAGAAGRVRDGPARSRRASADGVDQSGGAASRPSDRPCAQRVVSGSRKAPSPSNKPAHSTPVCPRFYKPPSATKTPRWIGWPSIFRQRWRRHLKPPPLRPRSIPR